MKLYWEILLASLVTLLASCNHHNEPEYTAFSIVAELEPKYEVLPWDQLPKEERDKYIRGNYVINSQDEFPTEPLMWLDDLKAANIDFDKYTLLLSYNLLYGIVNGHYYIWRKYMPEDTFQLVISFKLDRWTEETDDDFTYYRTALLVNKFPSSVPVEFWLSSHP